MSVKKLRRNVQTPVAVNEAASAALPNLAGEKEQFLRRMESTLRMMRDDLDTLRDHVGHALAVLRGFPAYVREQDLPKDCPGWGLYDIFSNVCALCDYNLDCMTAGDEREKPSREK